MLLRHLSIELLLKFNVGCVVVKNLVTHDFFLCVVFVSSSTLVSVEKPDMLHRNGHFVENSCFPCSKLLLYNELKFWVFSILFGNVCIPLYSMLHEIKSQLRLT